MIELWLNIMEKKRFRSHIHVREHRISRTKLIENLSLEWNKQQWELLLKQCYSFDSCCLSLLQQLSNYENEKDWHVFEDCFEYLNLQSIQAKLQIKQLGVDFVIVYIWSKGFGYMIQYVNIFTIGGNFEVRILTIKINMNKHLWYLHSNRLISVFN